MDVRILIFVVAVAAVAFAVPAQDTCQIHLFKEPREIVIDPTRIAICPASDSAPSLSDFQLAIDTLEPHPIPGWWIGDLSEPSVDTVRSLSAGSSSFVSPVFLDGGSPLIITPTLFIGFEESIPPAEAERILTQINAGEVLDRDYGGMAGVYRVRSHSLNGLEVLDTANALVANPRVRFAEPDCIMTGHSQGAAFTPNDPGFTDLFLWGLHNVGQFGGLIDADMDVLEAWSISLGDPSVKVGIIDVGVQQDHPDLNQLPGRDFTDEPGVNGGPANEFENHGTPVASCVTSLINNGLGTIGVAPHSKSISLRTFISLDESGSWVAFYSWTADALLWVEGQGARVSNNSNSYDSPSALVASAYDDTHARGMIHFASSGNESTDSIGWPASHPTVNGCGSISRSGNLSSFSNWGEGTAFVAPGSSIYLCDRTGDDGWTSDDYTFANGTSFATPYVAGVAALILSVAPNLTSTQVETVLQQSCVDLGAPGYDLTYGHGLVNAYEALLLVKPDDMATVPFPTDGHLDDPCAPLTELQWQPGFATVSHDVYLGTSLTAVQEADHNSLEYLGNTVPPHISVTGLQPDRLHHWRVDVIQTSGEVVMGDIWSFTTAEAANLLAHWPLNGNAFDTLVEHSGTLHDDARSGPGFDGLLQGSLTFDGVGDYVLIPDFDYGGSGGADFTLSLWFKTNDISGTDFQYIFGHALPTVDGSLNVFFNESDRSTEPGVLRTSLLFNNGSFLQEEDSTIPAGLADGDWHHYALTVSPTDGVAIHIDGTLLKSDPNLTAPVFNPATDIYLAARSDLHAGRHYGNANSRDGLIDDVRLFGRALCTSEIIDLYEDTSPEYEQTGMSLR